MAQELQIAAFAGSIRIGSFNAAALDHALKEAQAYDDVVIDRIDLANYPLPLYNADDQIHYGIPDAVYRVAARIAAATGLLVASPEYNGGYTPLFKNTIDWLSRVDRGIVEGRKIGIITASKSSKGGARSARQMADLFAYLRASVHEPTLNIGHAPEVLAEGHIPEMGDWMAGFVTAVREHVATGDAT